MGFFNKLKNWFTGKGFKADEEIVFEQEEAHQKEEIDKSYEEAEQVQVPTPEPERIQDQVELQPIAEPRIQPSIIKPKEKTELDKAVQEYEKRPTISQYEHHIDTEKVNRLDQQMPITDLANLKPQYTQILTENAKISDPEIAEILIQNRGKLQHRFEAEFIISSEEGVAATCKITGVLLEHTGRIYNYINVGQTFDSPQITLGQSLKELINDFENIFGAIGGSSVVHSAKKKITITDIKVNVTFA